MFNKFFFENPAVCEIMRKNLEQPVSKQVTIYYGANAGHAA